MIARTFLAVSAVALATSATAADLPMRKAAPVDYLRACTQHGAGFFFLPGTDTCLRIGGLVRADFVGQSFERFITGFQALGPLTSHNAIGMQARGQIDLDARTATPYGPVRTFLSYRVNSGSITGAFIDPNTGIGFYNTNFGASVGGIVAAPAHELARAYVEFNGFTAGRAYSFYNLPYFETFSSPFTADAANVMFAYTARFGQNWSVTAAIEDASHRRTALAAFVDLTPFGLANLTFLQPLEAGQRLPMFVGNVAYNDPTYSLQLSGAVREIRPISRDIAGVINPLAAGAFPEVEDGIGWAVQLGGQVRLPTLGPGDKLYGGVSYANGLAAMSGLLIDEDRFGRPQSSLGEFNGSYDLLTGRFIPTETIAGHLGLLHYWTPTLRSAVSGAVARTENSAFGAGLFPPPVLLPRGGSTRYRAMANLIWSPVPGLDIGAEVMYDNLDFDDAVTNQPIFVFQNGVLFTPRFRDSDQVMGTLRVQRRF